MRYLAPCLCLVALACSNKPGTQGNEQAYTQRAIERPLNEEGLLLQEIDLDANGTADIFNYFRERTDGPRLLIRKEVDLNRDGKVDVVSYFDETGVMEKEQMDSDYDGNLDLTDHYQGGVRVMTEYDTDFDGIPNVFKYYSRDEAGASWLDRKERDEDGDGKIDVWERFNRDGLVTRVGRDTDGDGRMDEREE